MVWWIVLGVFGLSIVVLAAVVTTVTGRLRPLHRSVRRLRLRAEQAEKLQITLATTQERAARLQDQIERLQRRRGTSGEAPEASGGDRL